MMNNQEEDEFVAVRVQDPRVQNEGSWNSYVDYKIFLHTNSKAFTAKTSCVRRRYSEFVWLKRKLQKNAGLVPVPDLPGKSFFSFSNEDFLEGRRKGLQVFLDKVVHMTVCLSDSQLHLFLQTQLPIGHIEDCVQGHTPYSVTDAILTYASSNRGLAQAVEDDSIKEPSLTVSYESMESPAPHQPCLQTKDSIIPPSCPQSDPLEGLLELRVKDTVQLRHKEKSSVTVLQKNNHLEAVVEASFFLGDDEDDAESRSLPELTEQRSCQIQTPVEVHSAVGAGFEEEEGPAGEDSTLASSTEERSRPPTERDGEGDANVEKVNFDPEKCVNSVEILDFKDSEAGSQEDILEDVPSKKQALENHATAEVNGLERVDGAEGQDADVSCPEEFNNSDGQEEAEKSDDSESREEAPSESGIHEETHQVFSVPEAESGQEMDQNQVEQEADLVRTKDESDEDSQSLPSTNESIVKVSDEESVCDENEDSIRAENGYLKTSPEDASSMNILDLHMNGCSVEKDDVSTEERHDLRYMTDISKSVDLNSTLTDGDLTENSDFSILETSCTPGLAEDRCTEQETLSSLCLDAPEETHEVEVR